MNRKWRSLFVALTFAVTALVPVAFNPPTVAAWNGIIMPGRVLRNAGDGPTSACRALAYGRADSHLVLFVANHCRDDVHDVHYGPAYTNGGVQIGWWGNPGTAW